MLLLVCFCFLIFNYFGTKLRSRDHGCQLSQAAKIWSFPLLVWHWRKNQCGRLGSSCAKYSSKTISIKTRKLLVLGDRKANRKKSLTGWLSVHHAELHRPREPLRWRGLWRFEHANADEYGRRGYGSPSSGRSWRCAPGFDGGGYPGASDFQISFHRTATAQLQSCTILPSASFRHTTTKPRQSWPSWRTRVCQS